MVKGNHIIGGSPSTCMAVAIFINCFASLAWSSVVEAFPVHAGGANFEGITWSSGEWFVPFGVRCFTSTPFFVLGTYFLRPAAILEMREAAWSSCWFKHLVVPLNLACCVYSLFRLELRGQLQFHSALPAVWLSRLPQHLELMAFCVCAPVLLLMVIPNRDLGLVTWAGRNTLIPYLFHPFLLKMMRPVWVWLTALCVNYASPGDLGILLALQQLSIPLFVFATLVASTKALGRLIRGVLNFRLSSRTQQETLASFFLHAVACWPLHLVGMAAVGCVFCSHRLVCLQALGLLDFRATVSKPSLTSCSPRQHVLRLRQVVPIMATLKPQVRCSVFTLPAGYNVTHLGAVTTKLNEAVHGLTVHACDKRAALLPTLSFACQKQRKGGPSVKECQTTLAAWHQKRGHSSDIIVEPRKLAQQNLKILMLQVHYRRIGGPATPSVLVSEVVANLAC